MKTTVVVPIYKKSLSDDEIKSLKQCFKILHRYPITFVTHRELDTAAYMQLADNTNVSPKFEYFDKEFFFTVNSYSRLLLSRDFYSRFVTEDFIFIYQLDGFVFKDELEDWCKKGFDYVGAPWLIHYGRGKYKNSNQLWKVGNGGVSLRKVDAFLERFDKNMPLAVLPFYVKNIRKRKLIPMMIKTLKLLFYQMFSPKSVEYCLMHLTDEAIPEDCFWADGLSNTKLALKVPNVMTAASFCFEMAPEYLYQQLQLPILPPH